MGFKVELHPEMLADLAGMSQEDQTRIKELINKIQQAAETSDDPGEIEQKLNAAGIRVESHPVGSDKLPAVVLDRLHNIPTKQ